MAFLYITEYASISVGQAGRVQQHPDEPPLADNRIAITGGSTVSPVFNAQTRTVRIHTDTVCSIAVGVNPVASISNQRLAANQTEYKGVPLGGGCQVAVIANV